MIKQTLQREIKRRIEKVKITVLGSYAENPSGLSWMAWRRWESWSFTTGFAITDEAKIIGCTCDAGKFGVV